MLVILPFHCLFFLLLFAVLLEVAILAALLVLKAWYIAMPVRMKLQNWFICVVNEFCVKLKFYAGVLYVVSFCTYLHSCLL